MHVSLSIAVLWLLLCACKLRASERTDCRQQARAGQLAAGLRSVVHALGTNNHLTKCAQQMCAARDERCRTVLVMIWEHAHLARILQSDSATAAYNDAGSHRAHVQSLHLFGAKTLRQEGVTGPMQQAGSRLKG